MKSFSLKLIVAVMVAALAYVLMPLPRVSVSFEDGASAQVLQEFEPNGHFHLEVHPKEALAKMEALTIGGMPFFTKEWLLQYVKFNAPLGESEIVDCPRFFDFLLMLLSIGKAFVCVAPLLLFMVWRLVGLGLPHLRHWECPFVFICCLVVFSVCQFPLVAEPSLPGLDNSWSWFLSYFSLDRIWGADVVFTYGPLGFLLYPQWSLTSVLCALCFDLMHIGFAAFLLGSIYRDSSDGRKVAWGLLLTMLYPQESMEWRWVWLALFYTAWIAVNGFERKRCPSAFPVIAGFISAVVSMVKFSSIVIILGGQGICWLSYAFCLRRRAIRDIGVYMLSFGLVFAFLALTLFPTYEAIGLWIKGSVATAIGYNSWMVIEKPTLELALPILVIAVFSVLVRGKFFLLAIPVLFLTAKYAWVRQSSLPLVYMAISFLSFSMWRERGKVVLWVLCHWVGWIVSVAILVFAALLHGKHVDVGRWCGLSPIGLVRRLNLPKAFDACQRETRQADDGFEECWYDLIATNRTAFLPFEYAPAMKGRDMRVVPLPSLQLYSGCHPYLDDLNAKLFLGETAPEFIVCGLQSEWAGHGINYPRTWLAVLSNYRFVDSNDAYVLLRRQANWRRPPDDLVCFSSEIPLGTRLRSLCFRNALRYLQLETETGEKKAIPYIVANQGVPYPLDWIFLDNADMLKVLSGGCSRVCRAKPL